MPPKLQPTSGAFASEASSDEGLANQKHKGSKSNFSRYNQYNQNSQSNQYAQYGQYNQYNQHNSFYQNQAFNSATNYNSYGTSLGYQAGGVRQAPPQSYQAYLQQQQAAQQQLNSPVSNNKNKKNDKKKRSNNQKYQNKIDLNYSSSEPNSNLNSPNPSTVSLTSLNNSFAKLEFSPISQSINEFKTVKSLTEVRKISNDVVEKFINNDTSSNKLNLINTWDVENILKTLSKNKNPALVRESAIILLQTLIKKLSSTTPNELYFLKFLQYPLDSLADKENSIKRSAQTTLDLIYNLLPIQTLSSVLLPILLKYLSSSAKWNSKIGALKLVNKIITDSPVDLLEFQFYDTIPVLTDVMTDFKPELAKEGLKTITNFISILDNLDLKNRYEIIIETLGNPKKVPDCIMTLSSITFVAEVTEPTLSLLVPIVYKSLNLSGSSQEQLRKTVVITENLTRLVNNKREIEKFIPLLLPSIKKVVDTASLPEVRELASKALKVIQDADNEKSDNKFHGVIGIEQTSEIIQNRFKTNSNLLSYLSTIIMFDANVNDWQRLQTYLEDLVFNSEESKKQYINSIIYKLREIFHVPVKSSGDDGIEIVNSDFSLAYGSRMLLNKTNLRLLKGHRYGLCGRNGAGKSTLMRSIANGQLEGFPSKEELRTCFVEHKLQGSEADLDLASFIAQDEELEGISKEAIASALADVGFDEERRAQNVGSLSGGWKMKLELARAMLMKADVLLLDEPTNHLDVGNVKWLEDYLKDHTEITSLIVSHDSGFLDSICTDIIHYENKKLIYYKGNLSEFVKVKPEGKSYYTLSDSNVKMAFPPPGILTGVKSNTRAVAKMTDVTFSYPGSVKPSLKNVSCALSLSSRVAILGPNGAGKSTLIKLLTGELVPQEGKVEKHPNLRIGYIAQHALQHVEQHKEKTANQYLQWRYRFGDDREVLLKESRKIGSNEEKKMMEHEFEIDDGKGKRAIEAIVGRQKLKKTFQYEIKWKFWLPRYNSWVSREKLIEEGFNKLVQKFDDHEASREGLGYRDLTPSVIRKHFEDVGLDGEIADHTPLGSLSGGQLVKVVIAGAMWNNPHLLVLDEPTNYLDRDSLGGLAVAIRDWSGGVVMISHNNEFVGALCPEQWIVENGTLVNKSIEIIDENRFEDGGHGNLANRVIQAKKTIENDDSPANIKVKKKKKKLTRNEKKAREEFRRLKYIEWLSSPKGTPKPVYSDDED
ncbi:New1p [Ascoidea rubescens DSM 1968]|uniref:ATP binding cassette family member n=1 Tax=Ascoidea rubescens DSM 1968 TaxID=1344418 RepID=A0A1D2VPZ9_9ASCO|nr:ATP binding cassette family member [Ascoidea rubescens DSM 1968]ODV63625.1 ATP binding cassette family member [Ascoidea rubescens DSM 1968]